MSYWLEVWYYLERRVGDILVYHQLGTRKGIAAEYLLRFWYIGFCERGVES
jgi:hypothetical protein